MSEKAQVIAPLVLRSEPSIDGAPLAEVPVGATLEVLERTSRYARVSYRDARREVEGWAAAAMLSLGPAAHGKSLVCPVCGSNTWCKRHASVQSSAFFSAPVHLESKQSVSGRQQVELIACICLACGYVSWFVPLSQLGRLDGD